MISGQLALRLQSDYNRLIISGIRLQQLCNQLTGVHTLARDKYKCFSSSYNWYPEEIAEICFSNSLVLDLDLSAIATMPATVAGNDMGVEGLKQSLNIMFSDKLMAAETLRRGREELSESVDRVYSGIVRNLEEGVGFLQNYLTPFLNGEGFEEAAESLSFSDLAIHLDEVAGKLQNSGYTKLATTVDAVTNEYEKEAGAFDHLKKLGLKALEKIMALPSLAGAVHGIKALYEAHKGNLEEWKHQLARELAEALGVDITKVLQPRFLLGKLMQMLHNKGEIPEFSKTASSTKLFQSKLIILAALVLGGLFLLKGISVAEHTVEKVQQHQQAPTSLEAQMAEMEK